MANCSYLYSTSLKYLERFRSEIRLPAAERLIAEALDFLNRPANQHPYFVLECGEIFGMLDTPLAEQNQTLLEQLPDLRPEMDAALQTLRPPPVAWVSHWLE